jgi:hypothetical protein
MAAEDDIATLEAQLAQGVRQVRHADGRQVEYESIDARLKALGYFRAKSASAGGVSRTTLVTFVRD